MLDIIAKLVDFDPEIFDHNQIIEDFTRKFYNSWIIIDGSYYKVLSILPGNDDNYKLKVSNVTQKEQYLPLSHLRKITPYMPTTGLYKSEHGLIYLSRIPARQWLKSYAEGKNYLCSVLAQAKGTPTTHNTILNPNTQYHPETMLDHNDNVWLHWREVGTLHRGSHTIYLNDNTFIKEITELWPQYQTTSDVRPRPDPRDERLITDF